LPKTPAAYVLQRMNRTLSNPIMQARPGRQVSALPLHALRKKKLGARIGRDGMLGWCTGKCTAGGRGDLYCARPCPEWPALRFREPPASIPKVSIILTKRYTAAPVECVRSLICLDEECTWLSYAEFVGRLRVQANTS
jgi:hypothetical protein